jgi:hypothetical protein
MALQNQTTTAQKLIDFCSLHTSLQNYFNVAGVSNEPGMTIANNVIQGLLVRDMPWKFNRKELAGPEKGSGNFFVTQYGVQDYRFAGAVAFVLNTGVTGSNQTGGAQIDLAANPINGGTAGITVSGGIVTVQTIDPHPFQQGSVVYMSGNTVAAYNSTYSFNALTHTSAWTPGQTILTVPDNLHFTMAAISGQTVSSGAPGFGTTDVNGNLTGLYPWGWLESASVQDINSSQFPQPQWPIAAVRELPVSYQRSGNQYRIAMMIDFQNGVIKLRMSDPPGNQCLQVNMVYQGRAPKMTKPDDVFPWPDDMAFVLHENALAHGFRYAKGITAEATQMQMKMADLITQRALAGENREEDGFSIVPELSLMR